MSSSPDPPRKSGGGSAVGITVGVGVPIILVIATAVIVLVLVLLYLRYRAKQKHLDDYHPVPTSEVDHGQQVPASSASGKNGVKRPSPGSSILPYPVKLAPKAARVQMDDPKPPNTFVYATQLESSGGTGYQFNEPKPLSAKEKQRYELVAGKNRDGGGRRVHLHSAELTDSSDQESTSRSSSKERRVSGQASPRPGRKFSAIVAPVDYSDQPRLPEVCFQLKYSERTNRLTIKIERVAYLPYREDGAMVDAYIRLFFIPKLQELPQRKTSKTQTQRGTSPVFDETIVYEAMTPEEVINSTLHVEALDYRSYGKHQILGQGDLPLIQVKFEGDVAAITLPLHLPKVKENLGTVLLSLCYSPEDKKLSVIILRAKDLNKGNARETVPLRQRALSKRATGVAQWERERLARQETPVDFDALCQKTIDNVKRCRYAKASDVNKIFDNCTSTEQLSRAEEVLRSFRHSLNMPRSSLPLVVARACVRVGRPEVVMSYVRDEVQYGLFPSTRVYNVIMDAMLKKKKPKGALSVLGYMTSHEAEPDGMTYFLATKASYYYALRVHKTTGKKGKGEGEAEMVEEGELDISRALELCRRCVALEPKLATKGYRFIVGALLREGLVEKASQLLSDLEKQDAIPRQSLFNLCFDVLLTRGDLTGAVSMLSELCCHDNKKWQGVGAPQRGLPRLQEAIEQSQEHALKESFERLKTALQTCSQSIK